MQHYTDNNYSLIIYQENKIIAQDVYSHVMLHEMFIFNT